MERAWVSGTGAALPENVLTNADLEKMVDTNDAWIVQRTGIRERRILDKDRATSSIAVVAGRRAITDAGLEPGDIDAVICATLTPDKICPALAATVQSALEIPRACAFDINAACTGFVYGVAVSNSLIQSGMYRRILLVGAEGLSKYVDYTDRNSCILFGDGAGAAVISRVEAGSGSEILDSVLRADGDCADFIDVPAGGTLLPATEETVRRRQHYLRLKGREVFKFATKAMVDLVGEALSRNGFDFSDLDLVIPHQVNYRIIEAAIKKLDLPEEKLYLNLDRYGNTSAASVPIALAEATREGKLERGMLALCVAFGAGMTWGYNLIRW